MLSYYFKIPFPEDLPDEDYWEKVEQLKWIREFEKQQTSSLSPKHNNKRLRI